MPAGCAAGEILGYERAAIVKALSNGVHRHSKSVASKRLALRRWRFTLHGPMLAT